MTDKSPFLFDVSPEDAPSDLRPSSPPQEPLASPPSSAPSHSWPRYRAMMDEALEHPKGIRIHYPSWNAAEQARNQLGKIRRSTLTRALEQGNPLEPGYGFTPYSALTFSVEPDLRLVSISVVFLWNAKDRPHLDLPPSTLPVVESLARQLPKEKIDASIFKKNVGLLPVSFRSLLSACTIEAQGGDGTTILVEYAPSFKEGWDIIRRRFPAWLYLRNTYNLEKEEFEVL